MTPIIDPGTLRRKLRCELQQIEDAIKATKPKDPLSIGASHWQGNYSQALNLNEDVQRIQSLFLHELEKLLQEPLYNEPLREAVLGQDQVTYDPLLLRLWTHETGLQGAPLTTSHPIANILIAYRNTRLSLPKSSPKYEAALDLEKRRIEEIRRSAMAKQESRNQRLQNMIASAKQNIAHEMAKTQRDLEESIEDSENIFHKKLTTIETEEQRKATQINHAISRLEKSAKRLDLEAKTVEKETKQIREEISMARNETQQLDYLVQQAKEAIEKQGNNNLLGALGTIVACCAITYGFSSLGSGVQASANPIAGGVNFGLRIPI